MVVSVGPDTVLASASAESAISGETAAAASAASPVLLGVLPMGGDPDSAMFAAALNACGGSYLGVVSEHAAQRGLFAGTQSIASSTYVVTELMRSLTMAIGA